MADFLVCCSSIPYFPPPKKNFQNRLKIVASGRKNIFQDIFWPKFCFYNSECICSLGDLKLGGNMHFYVRNKKIKMTVD